VSDSIAYLANRSRIMKWLIIALADSFCIMFAFWASFFLRLDSLESVNNPDQWLILSVLVPLTIAVFWQLNVYHLVLRFINSEFIWRMMIAAAVSTIIFVTLSFYFRTFLPRSTPIIYVGVLVIFVCGVRLLMRKVLTSAVNAEQKNIIIYGAGSAGRQLANSLEAGGYYKVVGFVDDSKEKQNTIVQDVKVLGIAKLGALIKAKKVAKILLALPDETRKTRNSILNQLQAYSVKVQSMPDMNDMLEGEITSQDLIDVEIDDLLGREAVVPIPELLRKNIRQKNIMVTGAGGSIGSELCRQVLKLQPKSLVLFDICEYALYQIEQELHEFVEMSQLDTHLYPILGSVQDYELVERTLSGFQVATLYHAAAYKHVPLVEQNMVEGVKNNIFGTYNAAKAALAANVETFVLISTDKAVRPTNVMGATKRMAELVLQALSESNKNSRTKFAMVRFGNVLGSSGSVIPLFRQQIKEGGPVTITHPEITRYFMTIPEASQLVIQAGAMTRGGDVFVLDMGAPVKINDLAEKLIRLSGLEVKSEDNPTGDIEIKNIRLRPGEKLYEELLVGDNVSPTHHERIMKADEDMLLWPELNKLLSRLTIACTDYNQPEIKRLLQLAPLGYETTKKIHDLLYLNESKHSNKALSSNEFAYPTSKVTSLSY
jgi:FlaA1/EpsC-like NDP-sugar epimerase